MTPKQYIEALARLDLSQRAAGRFLKVDERTSRRWVSGESAIPESVALLLRLMIKLKLKLASVGAAVRAIATWYAWTWR